MDIGFIFKSLFLAKIKYLIVGGLAVNLYGVNRTTADIDILLDFKKDNIAKFQETVNNLNYLPTTPLDFSVLENEKDRLALIEEKNLIAYSFYNSNKNYLNLDVIIDTPKSFNMLWNNKETRTVEDFEVYIANINDLIELKEYSNRSQDKNDILLLKSINQC